MITVLALAWVWATTTALLLLAVVCTTQRCRSALDRRAARHEPRRRVRARHVQGVVPLPEPAVAVARGVVNAG